MSAADPPKQVTLTLEEAEALKARLQTSASLSSEDIKIVTGLITFSLWLQQQLSLAKLSIRRLKKIFGFSTEKKKPAVTQATDLDVPAGIPETGAEDVADKTTKPRPTRDPNKNHGRHSSDDYSGCPLREIKHAALQAGDHCPRCAEVDMRGKLSAIKPGVLIRLQGQPLITGQRYQIEKLRCGLCGEQYTASVPPSIAQQSKYAPSCMSTLAIGHYYMGLPFYRIEYWQRFQGVPLADATQWLRHEAVERSCFKEETTHASG